MVNGSRNRSAGKKWELDLIKRLRERHIYPHAVSTRSESRSLDGQDIDIMNRSEIQNGMMLDSIQNKSSVTPVPYSKLLARIRESQRPGPVVFHRQTGRSGKGKFMVRDEFAITYANNYMDLMAYRQFYHWLRKHHLDKLPAEHRTPILQQIEKLKL